MERSNLNFSLTCFHLVFILFTCSSPSSSTKLTINSIQDDVCASINCGQGTCKASSSFPGFDCECNAGWRKLQIGPLTFPACVIPNCTINFECSKGSPPPPPPPVALPPPPLNFLDHKYQACNLVWCGDGTCKANGTRHICQCYEGSANLFNLTDSACFKPCYFGADCYGLGLGQPPPPPTPNTSGSPGNDSTQASNFPRNLCASTMTMLAVIFLTWL